MSTPKLNTAYVTYISLTSRADAAEMQVNPTLGTGDVKVSIGGAALVNITTLPVVTPAGSVLVKVSLSAAEMNDTTDGKTIVVFSDAVGDEWSDLTISIDVPDVNVEDITRSTTPANTLDINATGEAGVDLGNVSGVLGNANVGWVDANDRVDIGQWLSTAVTVSSTTLLPEVDAKSISDSLAAANSVESNISNLDVALSDIAGTTFSTATDSLEAIRNRGDVAWITAVGFSSHSALDVWHVLSSSIVTASTIGLQLKTNVDQVLSDLAGSTFNTSTDSLEAIRNRGDAAWITATGFNTVVPMTATLSQTEHDATQSSIAGLNDIAATDIVSAGPITTLSGAVVNVDLVDVLTTNNDKTGYSVSAAVASFFQDFFTVDSGEVSGSEVSGSVVLEIAKIVLDRVNTGANHNITNSLGKQVRMILEADVLDDGTAQAGSSTTITLAATADSDDRFYEHTWCVIVGGTGAGQVRAIHTYNGTTKVATLTDGDTWVRNPDNTSEYEVVKNALVHVGDLSDDVITAATLATDAVAEITTGVLTTVMTESYRSVGAEPTLAQVGFEIIAQMGDHISSGTTRTIRKIDGTDAKTYTYDNAINPTSVTETT